MKGLCIYHGACDDGFAAAFAVWQRYGDGFEYYPGKYQEDPPDVCDRDVIMVDFSYRAPVIEAMSTVANSILILDHHKTAAAELVPWTNKSKMIIDSVEFWPWRGVMAVFDMERSGAMMAWEFFHPEKPVPEFFSYIQDRDLYTRALPGTDQFTIALRSYPQDFQIWSLLKVDQLIDEGHSILRYYRQQIEALKNHVMLKVIGGVIVPAVNAPYAFASEIAGELASDNGSRFAASYYEDSEGKHFSLRSDKNNPQAQDVSDIARLYGGGGHKHAAGFKLRHGKGLDDFEGEGYG